MEEGHRSRSAYVFAGLAIVIVVAVAAFSIVTPPQAPAVSASAIQVESDPATVYVAPSQAVSYASLKIAGPASLIGGPLYWSTFMPPGLNVTFPTSVKPLADEAVISYVLAAGASQAPGKYVVQFLFHFGSIIKDYNLTVVVVQSLVVMLHEAFLPANLTVKPGTTVTFLNLDTTIGCCDPGYHTVVFRVQGMAASPVLKRFDLWNVTMPSTGAFDYYCSIHPSMTGEIVVAP